MKKETCPILGKKFNPKKNPIIAKKIYGDMWAIDLGLGEYVIFTGAVNHMVVLRSITQPEWQQHYHGKSGVTVHPSVAQNLRNFLILLGLSSKPRYAVAYQNGFGLVYQLTADSSSFFWQPYLY